MNKRLFCICAFFAFVTMGPIFAAGKLDFETPAYSGSIMYNDSAQPGDAVFARLSIKISRAAPKKSAHDAAAVMQLFKGDKKLDSTQFFFANPKNRKAAAADMIAGIPLSTWYTNADTFSLKVIISAAGSPDKELTLPFTMQTKEFISERIPLDSKNTGIKKNKGTERLAQIDKLNALLETVVPENVYTLKAFTVPVVSKRKTSTFGDRRIFEYTDKKTSTSLHYGIDYGVPTGTLVQSCAEGKVVMAENRISTGWSVVIEHLPGLYSLYYHLDSLAVKEGQNVKQGEKLGLSGATGLATGPHLHWEVRLNMGAVNPEFFLQDFTFQNGRE